MFYLKKNQDIVTSHLAFLLNVIYALKLITKATQG